jgi:transcriptional regulator with XRE-family HTH domain
MGLHHCWFSSCYDSKKRRYLAFLVTPLPFMVPPMGDIAALVQARRLARDGSGRALRERAELSVREMAHDIGVDVATLSRWERGECRPRRDAAVRWVTACNVIDDALRTPIHDGKHHDPGASTPGSHENIAAKQVLALDSTASEGADERAP